ncbi:carbohydrate ABC transporter permease [Diplocloster modestus]|uniref:Carbohydrate ABC transporter permease n=1 Tax=Diplocloster modestus TaxID=2850322 RepID=A0ABS6K7C8_9FIRM|nr:carbohydrate ABC transporter permease [Diplocloster modestus]MBU9726415.1 carbohydrate ABC transporter permease [Diplocloster modestus]
MFRNFAKKSRGEKVFTVLNYLFLSLLTIIIIYPFVYVVFASFSDPFEIMSSRGLLLKPKGFSLESYKVVFHNPNIWKGYLNTLFILVFGTGINILLTSFAAYALSRPDFKAGSKIMVLIVFTMMFNGGIIPTYILIRNIGLFNNLFALILPTAINTTNLIIMRTAFREIPDSLLEAAKMDGANDFQLLFKIVMPLSKATVAVMVLFYAVYHWNAWFNASLYLMKRELYPLQLILRDILIQNDTASMTVGTSTTDTAAVGQTIKYATIMVSTLPILCAYPFLQRFFVKGVMIGAVKE